MECTSMSICVSYNSHIGFAGPLLPPPLLAEFLHPLVAKYKSV